MTKLINKYVLAIIGFYIFWIGVMPYLVTNTVVKVCENLSHNSKYEILLENPRTKFSPIPNSSLVADKIKIKSKINNTEAVLENFKMKLRLLPLLSGRLHINTLRAQDVDFVWTVQDAVQIDEEFFESIENTKVRVDSVKIDNFKSLIYPKLINTPIKYSGKNFIFQQKNRYVKFSVDSKLEMGNKASKANFNMFLPKNNDLRKTIFEVEVSNFDISPLRIYFKHYLPKDLKDLRGVIDIHANKGELVTELKRCAFIMTDEAKSMIFPSKMNIHSRFNITRHFIKFEHVDIDSEKIHLSFNGLIKNYFGKAMPTLDLNFMINPTQANELIKLLPALKFEEIDLYKLKKYRFNADVLANFSIKGRLPEPDVEGDIYIDNAVLVKPIPNTNRGATIKFDMNGKYAEFDVVVPTGRAEKVWVKGNQELYNVKFADFTVKSTKSVDLKVAQSVLNPLHEILNFIIGPLPIMDIDGNGNIEILVKGNRKNPHIWGRLNFEKASVKLHDMPNFVMSDSDAVLTFNDQNVIFKTLKGIINSQDASISGFADLFGKFDFDLVTHKQPTTALYQAIQLSQLVSDIKNMIPKIDKIEGYSDLKLKIYGEVKSLSDLQFNKNFFAKGEIVLNNNNLIVQNVPINNTTGVLRFDTSYVDADLSAKIGEAPLSINAKINDKIGNLVFEIPRFNPNFLINDKELQDKQYLPFINVSGKYNGNINDIEYEKLNLIANIIQSNPKSPLKFQSGIINVINGKTSIKDLKGYISNPKNIFQADLRVDKAFSKTPEFNGGFKLKTPDLSLVNEILSSDILPKGFLPLLKNLEFKTGALDLNCKIVNNNVNANADLGGISFVYLPLELPVEIINGATAIKNNTLKLYKINILADEMPILLDGEIKDVFDKQNFNLYLNSKPRQDFIDKYINKNQIYPIKIKGDIVYWARLKGNAENYDLKSNINMSKDSSFYHFGATVGDVENAISLYLDSKITAAKNLKIKEFSYDKLIDSQSGKQTRLNMLKAYGGVDFLDDDIAFKDLRIKTTNPTDARIFNIIFRKPNIKQGQFISDLKLNGKLSNPKVLGDFHIFETDIPFFDTTMKNIELVFKDKVVNISSKGEVMGNDVSFDGVLKNKLTIPYHLEKGLLYTKDLDLNRIVEKLKLSEVDNISTFESFEDFELSSITFNNLKFKADNIQLRNIHATNYEATTSLDSKGIFNVNDFIFNIAQGVLKGKYNYNLKTNDMGVNLVADNINANDITWALFDLKDQIYGDMTGTVNLTCNGTNFQSCMQSLSGESIFNVKNGRMPKLGSLEYLLKASNLVKGGLTNLSINGVIDIITPLKTGEFSDIYGNARIKDGIARSIEIATRGKNLSLFISGTYNFATSIADMQVLGLLSRKISTMFGPVGNLSINTLFNVIPGVDLSKDSEILEKINKIPGIELSSKAYRRFVADIKGDINDDNYVTSFKWIN